MGLPIERWARQATLLDPPPRKVQEDPNDQLLFSRLSLPRLNAERASMDDDGPLSEGERLRQVRALAEHERPNWKRDLAQARAEGPTALESFYGGLLAYPLASAGTPVNPAVNTETALWATATYTPIAANSLMVPEVFRIAVTGQWTSTATASPTLVLTPRVGTTTGGATLGASRAIPLVASITAANFYLMGDLTCRTIGDGATAGSMIAHFHFMSTGAAGSGALTIDELFGHAVATFDTKVAQGLFLGMTSNPAGATTSVTIQQLHWMSWN